MILNFVSLFQINSSAKPSRVVMPAESSEPEPAKLPGVPTRRKNSLERPWDWLQISTWLLFPIIVTHYFAFIYFLLWKALAAKVVLTVVFGLSAIAAGTFATITCNVDPADEVLCSAVAPVYEDPIHCYICDTDVHPSSKHCRYCDKCVVGFDHHCKWLNTCIGTKNYRYFLGIVGTVFFMTLESFALSLALLVEAFTFTEHFMNRLRDDNDFRHYLGSDISDHAVQALLVVSVAIMTGIVGLLIQLGGFHIMLIWKGLTTYDFIVLEQKKQRERESERMQREFERHQRKASRGDAAAPASRREGQQEYSSVGTDNAPPVDEKHNEQAAVSEVELGGIIV